MNAEAITSRHRTRLACVYVRQSTVHQLQHHQESQRRQRALVDRAVSLGWPSAQVQVIDEDLGQSAARHQERSGFDRLVADVALGHVGIVLALEASRLSRSNRDWYHLLDLCSVSGTLIGDSEGLYDPRLYNDRLLLGKNRGRDSFFLAH
jgi:DNA invertase Pin-like site-specific DNA recombinase